MKPKAVVFDLDGTIYFGNELAYRANDVIRIARELCEGRIFFLTNNSAKSRKEIWQKLLSLGVNVKLSEVFSASYALAQYIRQHHFERVYCVGTSSLKEEIRSLGIVADSHQPQAVVVGYNRNFALNDLNELSNLLLRDYILIAANKERVYPADGGALFPGAGPIVSAVEFLLQKPIDVCIGKPNPEMLQTAVGGLGVDPFQVWMVGDSFSSDVQMAKAYGARSVWISKEKRTGADVQIEKLADLLGVFYD